MKASTIYSILQVFLTQDVHILDSNNSSLARCLVLIIVKSTFDMLKYQHLRL